MLGAVDRSRHKARRGLAIFFAIVVPLSAIFEVLIITTGDFSWLIPLVWVPALASVVARLVLREGFSDVSFRLGGRRGWSTILLALIFPIVVGLIAYGIAWMTTLAQFAPRSELAGDSASPLTAFVVILGLSTTIGTITLTLTAAGEEIGWRGYMLTRLIDSGVPRPVLVSGLLWGLWHVAGILTGVYATGPSPLLSAMLLMVTITSLSYVIGRMKLQTGSIWPAIAVHAAWNSIIVGAFDSATTGAGAALWVGESGVLIALTLVVAAFLFSRGRWTIRRQPEAQRDSSTSSQRNLLERSWTSARVLSLRIPAGLAFGLL